MKVSSKIISLLTLTLLGCTGGSHQHDKDHKDDKHGHSHERDKMMLADAGKYHAALTAHLTANGKNELDIFFETMDGKPKPAPLPLDQITAEATAADGTVHHLIFAPAEPDERKSDPPGQCSRFAAEAWWIKSDEKIKVVAKVAIDGKDVTIVWKDFHPKKYAHHDEGK